MSRNLKSFMLEDVLTTAEDVVGNLAEQVPGRSIGERYVTKANLTGPGEFEIELDDGSKFAFRCRKI